MQRPPNCLLINPNARDLTFDLREHREVTVEELEEELEPCFRLKKFKLITDSPTSLLASLNLKCVGEVTINDMSASTKNDQGIVYMNNVEKVKLQINEISNGSALLNYRFPSANQAEVVVYHEAGDHVDNTSSWLKCLSTSFCINELRLICDTLDVLNKLPEHITGSVSRLIFIPCDGIYKDMHKVCARFPYLETMALFTNYTKQTNEAKQAARQVRSVNPAVEVSFFDRIEDYFSVADHLRCTCRQHYRDAIQVKRYIL